MSVELAEVAADPATLDRYADPGAYIVLACERAKGWLRSALDTASIEEIVELKSQAEAIRVYTAQKNLGHDAELSAQEVVRRAERGIGLAIRKGQEAGEIGSRSAPSPAAITSYVRNVNGEQQTVAAHVRDGKTSSKSPGEYLRAGGDTADTYAMADGVTDDEFDQVIEEAKAEQNLSRANVLRKIHNEPTTSTTAEKYRQIADLAASGHTSRQIANRLGYEETGATVRDIARRTGVDIPAERVAPRSGRIDPDRVVEQTVIELAGLATGINQIDIQQVNRERVAEWVSSLTESLRSLNRLKKELTQL